MTPPDRVIKLGGSLLEMDGLAERFRAWRGRQPAMRDTMLVGGGRMADAVRDAFARHALSEEDAHWLCIRALGLTAELVARLLPEGQLTDRLDDAGDGPGLRILRPEEFLLGEERGGGDPLPHSWDVTSDSIAAWVAERLGADELVLLKSRLPANPGGQESTSANSATTREPGSPKRTLDGMPRLAAAGYVDRYFPAAAAKAARVRCVNLRDEHFAEVVLG